MSDKNSLGGNFNSLLEVDKRFKRFLLSVLNHTKRKSGGEAKSCAYGCVPLRANSLYDWKTW